MREILPLLNVLCIFSSAFFIILGWYFIKRKNYRSHRKIMIWAAISAIMFFAIYFFRVLFIGTYTFGGPAHLKPYYSLFLLFHIALAVTALLFGILTLKAANHRHFNKHKKLGPLTASFWFISTITGTFVYLSLYVLWDHGTIHHMFR